MGVPALLLGFVLVSSYLTHSEVAALRRELTQRLAQASTQADLDALQNEYDPATSPNPALEVEWFDHPLTGDEPLALSLSPAYARADRITALALLLLLLTIGISILISNALAKDHRYGRERSILSQCFSPPIVEKFYHSPEVIDRFYNHWMTVFFIDIRGFTKQAEKSTDDVEGLALKLRQVMDTARQEIVVSHEGIIDKFMGDAVMGWVGGHFSTHWQLLADLRESLYLDQLDFIEQDIKSIQREFQQLDPEAHEKRAELTAILQEAETEKNRLLTRQKERLEADPGLQVRYDRQIREYRRRVARSAVTCCLRINQAVAQIDDPEAFHELKTGIASGQVLVGNFGSAEQIAFTVLGPTVNRAARLEPASAQAGCKILLDEPTYELLKEETDLRFRRVPAIAVKGISGAITTYEPFFADQVTPAFLEAFEHGVSAIEMDNMEAAIAHFTRADQLRKGGDAAAQLWREECERALREGRLLEVKTMKK